MAVYYVDDGGDGSDGLTWAKAYTSINALDTAISFAGGDIVYFGHDHNCQAVNSAALTINGPTSGLPVIFISATTGSDPPAYQKGVGTQIDTTEGVYDVTLNGSFALFGILIKSGRDVYPNSDDNESFYTQNCTFALGAGVSSVRNNLTLSRQWHKNLIVDLTADATTPVATAVITLTGTDAYHRFEGLSFINAGYRTGTIFAAGGNAWVSGADFSGFNNATACELTTGNSHSIEFNNCKTVSGYALASSATATAGHNVLAVNTGPSDDPTALQYKSYFGSIVSSTSIYRSGGATIEGIANSWLVTTTANCNEYAPFHSPWLYSKATSTGSKTVSLYITNDTGDFTDAECWIEVEYLATSGSPLWTLASDQRATITTTAVAQTDDTTSTWVGSGPAYTYKQKLSVAVTIGEVGQIRARVVTGVASIASSRNFYIDPDSDKMVADA